MNLIARSTAVLSLSVSTVFAQGSVVQPVLRAMQNTPGLNPPNIPSGTIEQVNMVHLPNDLPGIWTCTMTCSALPAGNGGVGGNDLLSGKYDAIADVFTPDLFAAGLNTAGTDFGLVLDPTGLIAVWDDISGGVVRLATRPNLTSAFTSTGAVIGLPAQGYYDPALCYYHGQLQLLHVLGTGLAMSPLNLATRVVGVPRVIVNAPRAGSTANSSTPIMTTTGEIIGLSHHDVVASDNDHYMSFDLDPNTPALLWNDTATWTNNGGFCGGTFFDAEFTPAPYHAFDIQSLWWTGGRAQVGGILEVSAFSPPVGAIQYLSFFFLSNFFIPPVPIFGIVGPLGIDPGSLVLFDIGVPFPFEGRAVRSLSVPPDPALAGFAIPSQGLTIDLVTGQFYLLNTAAITIE